MTFAFKRWECVRLFAFVISATTFYARTCLAISPAECLALYGRVGRPAHEAPGFKEFLKAIEREERIQGPYELPFSVSAVGDDEWQRLGTRMLSGNEGINVVFRGVDGDGRTVAIVKHVRGSHDGFLRALIPELEKGGLGKREVLAYEIDQLGKFGLVPKTVFGVGGDGRLFTMQKYMDDLRLVGLRQENAAKISRLQAQKINVFDLLIGSYDRHLSNWMVDVHGRVALIDNGGSFLRFRNSVLNVDFPAWKLLPQADGVIEKELAEMILKISPSEFSELLARYKLPFNSRRMASNRLLALQEGVRAGTTMEQLVAQLAVRESMRPFIVLTGVIGGGVGGYYMLKK